MLFSVVLVALVVDGEIRLVGEIAFLVSWPLAKAKSRASAEELFEALLDAEELRRLVVCYQNGVEFPYFTAEQDAQKMVDDVCAELRGKGVPPPAS